MPPEIIKKYRKAKLYQLYLEELYEEQKPVNTSILETLNLDTTIDFSIITKEIRESLDISIDKQSKWKSAGIAFKMWRKALEANGIFIFKDAFLNDDYSGFCLYDEKYPIIFVNNSMADSRQVFTLFHELAHLLYRSGGIDFRSRDTTRSFQEYYFNIEVRCNRFGNEFLVPPEIFDSFPWYL